MKQLAVLMMCMLIAAGAFAQLNVSASVNNATCYGFSNGSASATVSGGSGSYTYQWDDPASQTTPTATNLAAGNYHLYVADIAGGDTTVEVHVLQPDSLVLSSAVTSARCNAAIGIIVMSPSGGTPPYSYQWSHPSSSSSSPALDHLLSGIYHVTVSDNNGCIADTAITVPEDECEVKGERVFTPNGDGINDTWTVYNIDLVPNYLLTVFNRWGQKVFESEGHYEPWDGKSFGIDLPDATYYYVLYQDKDNRKENVQTGSVTIVR